MTFNYKELQFSFTEVADLKSIQKYISNPKVSRYVSFDSDSVPEYFTPIIELMSLEGLKTLRFAFTIKQNNKIIGHAGLEDISSSHANFMLGYFLHEPYWGQGFGTIICEFLLDFAFNKLNAAKVSGDCFADNLGSANIMRKNGLKEEGCLRKQFFKDDRYYDQLLFGILKEEYFNK